MRRLSRPISVLQIACIALITTSTFCGCSDINSAERKFLQSPGLTYDSLKTTWATAVGTWEQTSWASRYRMAHFTDYVLPPQIASEPVAYYWRKDILRRIGIDPAKNDDIMALARRINRRIRVQTEPQAWGNPQMGYTATMSGTIGKCDDRAILAVMGMRAAGIPAAFEFVPNWGSNNNGHSFCTVILPGDSVCVFQDVNDDGENTLFNQKAPKIYRRMFTEQKNSIIYKYRDKEAVPPLFRDCNIADVTHRHDIGQRQVKVPIRANLSGKIAYLSVFTPRAWTPIAYTLNKGPETIFEAVGTGTNRSAFKPARGEDIGEGIVYLPVLYHEEGVVPASEPVIVSENGVQTLCPRTKTQTARLTRKYPRLIRIIRFADEMVGGVFEGANKPDFSDATRLHYITETPLSRLQRVDAAPGKAFRYLRYRKPLGTFSLGELRAYDPDGKRLRGEVIATDAIASEKELANIADDNPLTYFTLSGGLDLWAGLSFERPVRIARIEFCPRNDDNEIAPGDEYELFYWDDVWKSLGRKFATGYALEYTDVPKGALLWLRNRTKGREERPFTYENDTQIWW